MAGPVSSSKGNVKAKSRLGRGLSSLISVSTPVEGEVEAQSVIQIGGGGGKAGAAEVVVERATAEIALSEIVPNPHQPRKAFNDATIAELAASIKSTGLIQPLVVRKVAGGYQ